MKYLMQSVYICGDSFTVDDQDYAHTPWTKQLDAVSLGSVCANNQLIALQVEHAIKQQAKFIIVEFSKFIIFTKYFWPV